MRVLLWGLIAFAVYLLWRKGRGAAADAPRRAAPRPSAPPPAVAPATMVRCARCGLHLPAAEAQIDGQGRSFCSAGHLSAGPRLER